MPQVTVSISDEGTPLHKFIRQHPTFKHLVPSRSQAHLAFKQNQIVVNGSGNPPEGLRLKEGDIVFLDRQEAQPIQTKQISLVVSYRMDPWIVLWKASGLSMDGRSDVFANCVRALLNLTKMYRLLLCFRWIKLCLG
ncbi:hypothetical protein BCR33DRAFT_501499 [Rhizoclosmatium globosum]|uniref:RNA-binding S4 domain-containing protein n=1 Tax=Rhizoclosmatium globosum TaxID=329046 RepID=A0A1Y2CVM4_9FUNG|nr:hypothetical protein BCR33DRAFT_501499 [Rhizoclosmatium globosum]|eukprot:ORY51027.1 hypothetical protein BCR33DRAFT_501499 [Rhizoclosmatium globosum]